MSVHMLSSLGAAAILAMTAMTIPAHATLMVNIGGSTAGGTVVGGVTFFDNQAGVDSNPAIGVLDIGAFLDTVAVQFRINGFASTSGSPIASIATTANINLLQSTTVPVSVDVFISDNGFTLPPPSLQLQQTVNMLSSVRGVDASAVAQGWYGDSNTEFDVDGPSTANATALVKNGIAVNVPGLSGDINGPSPYSLTSHIKLTLNARGTDPIQNLQINANLAALGGTPPPEIPEPTTALLLGGSLLGLGAMFRMRKSG